jgi:hypothetical protein
MRPETRARRAIAEWRAQGSTNQALADAIAKQIGEAIYFERRTIIRDLRETARWLLVSLRREPEEAESRVLKDGTLAGLRQAAGVILFRNEQCFQAGWPGFAHRESRGRGLGIPRMMRELEIDASGDPHLAELSRVPNRFPGRCLLCGELVPPGAGLLEGEPGSWKVSHRPTECPSKPAA